MEREQILLALANLKPELIGRYPLKKIGIFGSLARNVHSERSDIDIVVELDNPNMFDLIGIKQEIEENLNCPVDIVRYRETMSDYLKQRIDNDALYV